MRYAMLVVVNADDPEDANQLAGMNLGPDAQYVSDAWEVAENDGSYDFDTVLAQRADGPTEG